MTDKDIEVIVKPIFTKMFYSNFSACEYGTECYKKGMEYQGIKELAIENDNLIKQVRILKEQIEKMKNWCNCKNYQKCLIELAEQGKGMNPSECCVNCDKWEIKENG